MALQNTDLIAVWRNTEQQNFKASITQLATAIADADNTLAEVLTAGNTSGGKDILITNSSDATVTTLSANNRNIFTTTTQFNSRIQIGSTAKILLKATGDIYGVETSLIGSTSTGNALSIYPAGTTIDNLDAGTQNPATVTITNAGVATFAGALEALSIDGGVYAS